MLSPRALAATCKFPMHPGRQGKRSSAVSVRYEENGSPDPDRSRACRTSLVADQSGQAGMSGKVRNCVLYGQPPPDLHVCPGRQDASGIIDLLCRVSPQRPAITVRRTYTAPESQDIVWGRCLGSGHMFQEAARLSVSLTYPAGGLQVGRPRQPFPVAGASLIQTCAPDFYVAGAVGMVPATARGYRQAWKWAMGSAIADQRRPCIPVGMDRRLQTWCT